MTRFLNILLLTIILTSGNLSAGENKATTDGKPLGISQAVQGFTAAQAYDLRAKWSLVNFIIPKDPAIYFYLNLSEVMPQSVISRAGAVKPLSHNPNGSLENIALAGAAGPITLGASLTPGKSNTQGFIVIHKGKIEFERYPGMRQNDNHVWMSNAKPVASLLIALLEEDGLLDVQQPIDHYLPELANTGWSGIRIINILNMATGIDMVETAALRSDPRSGISRFYQAETGGVNAEGIKLSHHDVLFTVKKEKEQGKVFEYSSVNTQVLGLLIERITGQKLSEVISARIWSKIGAEGDGLLALTPSGVPIIHGLISSRLRDMARFGLLYTPSWSKISNSQIVSPGILKKIQQGGDPEIYYAGTSGAGFAGLLRAKPVHNSYQWDAVFEDGDFYKSGLQGQGIYVSPSRDLVIVWFATGDGEIPMAAFARHMAKTAYPVK